MPGRAIDPPADNVWNVTEAGTRFEEVMRRSRSDGPQYVLRGGRKAVAVVDAAEFDRLRALQPQGLVPFLESLHLDGLDLWRVQDNEREPDL